MDVAQRKYGTSMDNCARTRIGAAFAVATRKAAVQVTATLDA
jgi:hypothetical protein